jgi:phage terminase large subunit-like protein
VAWEDRKTRSLVEFVREKVAAGAAKRVALVAPTAADSRNVLVEGPSGILACSPPWDRPRYAPSKRRLTWRSGAMATLNSADEPERLRGPQHDLAAVDELGSWRHPEACDTWLTPEFSGFDGRDIDEDDGDTASRQ